MELANLNIPEQNTFSEEELDYMILAQMYQGLHQEKKEINPQLLRNLFSAKDLKEELEIIQMSSKNSTTQDLIKRKRDHALANIYLAEQLVHYNPCNIEELCSGVGLLNIALKKQSSSNYCKSIDNNILHLNIGRALAEKLRLNINYHEEDVHFWQPEQKTDFIVASRADETTTEEKIIFQSAKYNKNIGMILIPVESKYNDLLNKRKDKYYEMLKTTHQVMIKETNFVVDGLNYHTLIAITRK